MTEKQIRTALDKLLNASLILKGQYRYDLTTWYALGNPICPDGQVDMIEGAIDTFAQKGERIALEGKSIRNRYKPDIKPYSSRDCVVVADDLEKVWLAYPEDKRRGKITCSHHIQAALTEVSFDDLISAVQAYTIESAGFTRSKVCFSDNWFRDRKWQRYLEELKAANNERAAVSAKLHAQTTAWVKSRSGLCRHLSAAQVNAAINAGLIERHEALDAGVPV